MTDRECLEVLHKVAAEASWFDNLSNKYTNDKGFRTTVNTVGGGVISALLAKMFGGSWGTAALAGLAGGVAGNQAENIYNWFNDYPKKEEAQGTKMAEIDQAQQSQQVAQDKQMQDNQMQDQLESGQAEQPVNTSTVVTPNSGGTPPGTYKRPDFMPSHLTTSAEDRFKNSNNNPIQETEKVDSYNIPRPNPTGTGAGVTVGIDTLAKNNLSGVVAGTQNHQPYKQTGAIPLVPFGR